MGLKQRSGESAKFLKVKNGKLYVGKDEQTPYSELEGLITDIYLKTDEYEGKKLQKLYIVLEDESNRYILNLVFENSLSTSLIGFLKSADLSQPITISPSLKKEKKEDGSIKEVQKFFVRQNGQSVKSFYTKEHPNGLPPMVSKKQRTGEIKWDKSEMMDFLAGVVEDELRPIAKKNTPQVSFREEEVPTVSQYATAEEVDESDLPF
jgi:hypothetical protein